MLTLQIGSRTLTNWDWSTLEIEERLGPGGDRADFEYIYDITDPSTNVKPQTEEEVQVTFDGSRIFGGIVESISREQISPYTFRLRISCVDYTKWLDRQYVSDFFTDGLAGDMVKSVINNYTTGFTTNNVNGVTSILPKVFNLVTVSEAIQQIADVAKAMWWVDFDRDIHFLAEDDDSLVAPIQYINFDTEKNIGGLQLSTSTEGIHNTLILKELFARAENYVYEPGIDNNASWPAEVDWPASWTGDDGTTRFDLLFPPYDLDTMTVEVNSGGSWSSKVVQWDWVAAVPGVSGGGMSTEVYVSPKQEKPYIRFKDAIANGDLVRVKYRPIRTQSLQQLYRDIYSVAEMSRRESAGGRSSDGVYEKIISLNDLEFGQSGSSDLRDAIAEYTQTILDREAWPRVNGQFITYSTDYSGWAAGQVFKVYSDRWDIYDLQFWAKQGMVRSEFGWIEAKDYLKVYVTGVTIKPLFDPVTNDIILEYTVQFSNVRR
jgi:hypothetical protein